MQSNATDSKTGNHSASSPSKSDHLIRPAQLEHFLAQPLDLLALLAAPRVRPQAFIGRHLSHTRAKRFRRRADIARDVRGRPAGLQRPALTALDKLIWVPSGSWHPRRVSGPEDKSSSIRSLRETQSGSPKHQATGQIKCPRKRGGSLRHSARSRGRPNFARTLRKQAELMRCAVSC